MGVVRRNNSNSLAWIRIASYLCVALAAAGGVALGLYVDWSRSGSLDLGVLTWGGIAVGCLFFGGIGGVEGTARARRFPAASYNNETASFSYRTGFLAHEVRNIPLEKIFKTEVAAPGLVEIYFYGPMLIPSENFPLGDIDQTLTLEGDPSDVAEFLRFLKKRQASGFAAPDADSDSTIEE